MTTTLQAQQWAGYLHPLVTAAVSPPGPSFGLFWGLSQLSRL